MMNRVIGVLFTLLTFAIIDVAIFNWGNYSSMIFNKEATEPEVVVESLITEGEEDLLSEEEVVVEVDSLDVSGVL